jgi:Cu2+-exporting ATPase
MIHIHALVILGGLAYAGLKSLKEMNSKSSVSELSPKTEDHEQILLSDKEIKTKRVSEPSPETEDHEQPEPDSPSQSLIKRDRITKSEINHYLAIGSTALGVSLLGFPFRFLCVPMLMYVAQPLFKDAFNSVMRDREIRASVVDSVVTVGTLATHYYVAASLSTLAFFLGHKLLLKTEDSSKKELANIFGQQPQSVWCLKDDVEFEISFKELQPEDLIVLQAGDMIPIDGTIVKGMASVDQHILTGEAQPVEKEPGDIILASTLIISGKIVARVDHAANKTTAAQIAQILQNTSDFKSSVEVKALQLSDNLAGPTLALGAGILIAMNPVSAIAIINCNYMINTRIASPLGVLNFLRLGSERGILVKDGRCLELLHKVDTVVFDKTGTLTMEEPHIGQIHSINSLTKDEIIQYAAAAEKKQTHPIARAILRYAKTHQLIVPAIEDIQYEIGYGIKVSYDDITIHVGSKRFIQNELISISNELTITEIETNAEEHGYALVYIALNHELEGVLELHVSIRPEAEHLIQTLTSRGIEAYIISGDHESPTKKLAQELGIKHYFSKVLPQDKARIIKELQAHGKFICFVGDGINDTVALKTANVSISIQGASTAATNTAGIILMDGTLNRMPDLFDLATEMDKNMKNSFLTALVPGAIGVTGVLVFHFKIYATIILYMFSLGAGVINSMLPVVRHSKNNESLNPLV